MTTTVGVAILDDHQAILDGCRYRLSGAPDIRVVATAACWSEMEALLAARDCDVLLMDINVPASPDNPLPFPILVEQHLYRIVQQAIGNALKHASATIIEMSGELSPAGIRLEVADNGVGFPAEQAAELATLLAHRHFGLVGMMERAWLVGGEATIETATGRGVRVTVCWVCNARHGLAL
jgi:signal transduction histidine kinase